MVFKTKFKNDKLHNRNGQRIKLVEKRGMFVVVKFPDGLRAEVYRHEIIPEGSYV